MDMIKDVIFAAVPGGFGALRRRYVFGAAVFAIWLFATEGYLLLRVIEPAGMPHYLSPVLLGICAALWAGNVALSIIAIYRRRRVAEGFEDLFAAAVAAFVAGDDRKTDEILRRLLGVNALDVDCLFLRAQSALLEGKRRKAKRLFRKCRDFDEEDKWTWEVKAALRSL